MPLNKPPIDGETLLKTGRLTQTWVLWFTQVWKILSGSEPVILTDYTVATLPSPSVYRRGLIYVTNETGGAVPAFSDGVNWRRVTDRAIVS